LYFHAGPSPSTMRDFEAVSLADNEMTNVSRSLNLEAQILMCCLVVGVASSVYICIYIYICIFIATLDVATVVSMKVASRADF
jgi:hypothetical protein